MWTIAFWKDVVERALKTFVYVLIPSLGLDAIHQPITELPWHSALLVSASATLLSVLGSIASFSIGNSGTASLTNAVEPSVSTGKHQAPDA